MGLFGRKRKLDNAAAVSIPTPGPTTIHNHEPSRIGDIIGYTIAGIISLIFLWIALSFLFGKMGGSDKEAALLIVSFPVILAAGWLLKWLIPDIILAIRQESHLFELEMAREVTRREEVRLLAAQTTLEPGRYNEADYEFARVILAVMMTAYDWRQKQGGADFRGQWRPWSMRSALETANGIGVKLSRDRANEVSGWLHSKGVITSPEGGQITKTFPDLSNVRVMLDREFGKPIVVNPPTLRDNRGFEHI